MRINVRTLRLAAGAAGVLAVLAATTPGSAHVYFPTAAVPANSSVVVDFRVPHGCVGSTTTAVQITIPAGIFAVQPKVKAGWAIETTRGPLAEPGNHPHRGVITEGVKTITYSGGLIPDDQYDDFTVTFYTPPQVDRILEFPVLQTCLVGQTNWNNTGGQEPFPAPQLTLTDPATVSTAAAPGVTRMVAGEQAAGLSSPMSADAQGRTQLLVLGLVALSVVLSGSAMAMASQRRNG